MADNVIHIPTAPHWRLMIAHKDGHVRHVIRTLVETEDTSIVEVADGEAAIVALERARFDVLVLQLDLPLKDGISVMQLHRLLLAHERSHVEPPAVVLTLAAEVRGNVTLTDHLRSLGVDGFIDDAPMPETAILLATILKARESRRARGKPAAA
jgi:CheY-like chemotaxis protein